MNHEYFKDRISGFHDGALKNEEEFAIAQHLKECEECRKLLADLRRLDRLVEDQSGLADDEYWERAARHIEHAITPTSREKVTEIFGKPWRGLWWKFASVAASVALITFIALYEGDVRREAQEKMVAPKGGEEVEALDTAEVSYYVDGLAAGDTEPVIVGADKSVVAERVPPPTPVKKSKLEDIRVPVLAEGKAAKQDADVVRDAEEVSPDQVGIVAEKDLTSGFKFTDTADITGEKQLIVKEKSASIVARAEPQALAPKQRAGGEVQDAAIEMFGHFAFGDTLVEPTLDEWRARRDSLTSLVTDAQLDIVLKTAFTHREEDIDTGSVISEEFEDERKLLEAHFQIARLTDDKSERQESISYLEDYFEKDHSRFKKLARNYLNQLKTE